MSGTTEIGLDTSGLVNYVYSSLPGDIEEDRGCQRLIDETAHHTVIGGKAKGEFEALCERRYDLYEDVIDYLLETENPIFEYDPRDRGIHVSPNDRTHFRKDIQMSWHDMERRKQLSTLRRCLQDIDLYQIQLPGELIDKCYPRMNNDELLERFQAELDIGHDCEILVDAVEISCQHSISILVAVDSDLTDPEHTQVVRDIIEEIFGRSDLLQICEPDEV